MMQRPTKPHQLRRNVYIDIDGVCLRGAATVTGIEPAPNVFEFLQWAVEFHRPYWLTTRDAHGAHDGILRAFRLAIGVPTLPAEIEALLKAVTPTKWHGSKVSGIDLGSDFVWIDDQPLRVEIEELRRLKLLNRLIVIEREQGRRRPASCRRCNQCAIDDPSHIIPWANQEARKDQHASLYLRPRSVSF